MTIGVALVLACVIVCAATDIRTGLVLDVITAPAFGGIVLWSLVTRSLLPTLVGAALCGGTLLALYVLTRGRGIGLGDVKLAAVIGGGLGGAAAVGAIGIAFVAGAVWAVTMLVARRARAGDRVPFAPFLAIGTIGFVIVRSVYVHG